MTSNSVGWKASDMKDQGSPLLPAKPRRTISESTGTSPPQIAVDSPVITCTSPRPIIRTRKARYSSTLSAEKESQVSRSCPSSPVAGKRSAVLSNEVKVSDVKQESPPPSPTYTMTIKLSGRLEGEKNLFVPQKYISYSVESPQGQVIDKCPLSCSRIIVTITDMPTSVQEPANASQKSPVPPSVAPTCTSSNTFTPLPPRRISSTLSPFDAGVTSGSMPNLCEQTPPPVPARPRTPDPQSFEERQLSEINADTVSISRRNVASSPSTWVMSGTLGPDLGEILDKEQKSDSSEERSEDDYEGAYIEPIPPRGWHNGAIQCSPTNSSAYMILQNPTPSALPPARDIDFFVTGKDTGPPVPPRGHHQSPYVSLPPTSKRRMSVPHSEVHRVHVTKRRAGSLDEQQPIANRSLLPTFKQQKQISSPHAAPRLREPIQHDTLAETEGCDREDPYYVIGVTGPWR